MDEQTIEKELMQLPAQARARLVDMLLSNLDSAQTREAESIWRREAEGRLDALHGGAMIAVDGPETIAELRRRYPK